MPSTIGQEKSLYDKWKKAESLILENITFTTSKDWEKVREEVKKILEETKNVCKINK